jgi:ornithine cyclodeaminase
MGAHVVRLLRRADVLKCIEPADVVDAVAGALIGSARGTVLAPPPLSFDFKKQRGEAHIKGAYLAGSQDWTVKLATGFYDNPSRGLTTASGLSIVSSSATGLLETIVLDGGHLTDVRTAAAGCLAVDALAPPGVEQVGVIGCGIQARIQLEYLLLKREPSRVRVFGRNRGRAEEYADEMSTRLGLEVEVAGHARGAVQGSQVVLTVTPSDSPVVHDSWIQAPAVVIAVGSDMPGKNELDPAILRRADVLAADDPAQASRVGELQHAPDCVDRAVALGDMLATVGKKIPADGLAVADLTGLGAEDAAIAGVVARRAAELDLGESLAVG